MKDLFTRYFKGEIHVDAIPYKNSFVDIVDPDWIKVQMNRNKIRLLKIVQDTGMDKSYLSSLINGKKPLSQMARSSYYYYLGTEQEK